MYGSTPEIAHWRIDDCVGAVVRYHWIRSVRIVRDRCKHASSSRKPCGLNQHIAVQLLMAVKQQQFFCIQKLLKDTVCCCNGFSRLQIIEKITKIRFASRRDDSNMRYRLNFEFRTKTWTVGNSGSQDRVVCYQVAKLHTTMRQSPIKVAGADHAV